MDRVSFTIFEPDGKKFHLTANWLAIGLFIMTISLLQAVNKGIIVGDGIVQILIIVTGLIIIYLLISSYFTYMPLFGKLSGDLVFEADNIIADGMGFRLSEIRNLDFVINDFYGKLSNEYHSFNPKYAQGVNNYITFTDNLNQSYIIYFKLATEHNYQELSPFINAAIKAKKMDFKRGVDLLGIENISIN